MYDEGIRDLEDMYVGAVELSDERLSRLVDMLVPILRDFVETYDRRGLMLQKLENLKENTRGE